MLKVSYHIHWDAIEDTLDNSTDEMSWRYHMSQTYRQGIVRHFALRGASAILCDIVERPD